MKAFVFVATLSVLLPTAVWAQDDGSGDLPDATTGEITPDMSNPEGDIMDMLEGAEEADAADTSDENDMSEYGGAADPSGGDDMPGDVDAAAADPSGGQCGDSSFWDSLSAQCQAGADAIKASGDWVCGPLNEVKKEDPEGTCAILCAGKKTQIGYNICYKGCVTGNDSQFKFFCQVQLSLQAQKFLDSCNAKVDFAKSFCQNASSSISSSSSESSDITNNDSTDEEDCVGYGTCVGEEDDIGNPDDGESSSADSSASDDTTIEPN